MGIGDPNLAEWDRQSREENRRVALKYELALTIKGVLGDKPKDQMTPEERRILEIVNNYSDRAKTLLGK